MFQYQKKKKKIGLIDESVQFLIMVVSALLI